MTGQESMDKLEKMLFQSITAITKKIKCGTASPEEVAALPDIARVIWEIRNR